MPVFMFKFCENEIIYSECSYLHNDLIQWFLILSVISLLAAQ